jgi:hypothetical protein
LCQGALGQITGVLTTRKYSGITQRPVQAAQLDALKECEGFETEGVLPNKPIYYLMRNGA